MMMVNRIDIEKVDKAQNGYDGYKMLQQKQYDFVICDLNMPVMDGYEAAMKIRNYLGERNLEQPMICAVTGHCEEDYI